MSFCPTFIVSILFVPCYRLTVFGYLEECSRRTNKAAIGTWDKEREDCHHTAEYQNEHRGGLENKG